MDSDRQLPEDLPMWGDRKNSVAEVRTFLDMLGAPDRELNIVHVAGTNGKGSVCAYLTQAFLDAGFHTGTFISPHLVNIRERILIDNHPVSEESFTAAAERVRAAGELWERKGGSFPAYFEYLFYMGMLIFRDACVDVVMLETGLGGRLDATNSCAPVLTVITGISLDHMQYLGDTVEKIAAEKAGILKAGVPAVYDGNRAASADVIAGRARELNIPAYRVCGAGEAFSFLPAQYMRENAALAAKAWELLCGLPVFLEKGVAHRELRFFAESVRRTHWTGRMDEIRTDVFLDGGHNEDGVRAMTEAARALCSAREKAPVLLTSAVNDKDLRHMAEQFAGRLRPRRVYVAPLNSCRAADADAIAALYRENGISAVQVMKNVPEAWGAALSEKSEDEILFAAGSLYLVGEILAEEQRPRGGSGA